jgi:FkbM family methyltransferase
MRLMTLRLLQKFGIRHFRARSSVNQPFICHVGDSLGQNPFYNSTTFRDELVLMAAWCQQFAHPIIFDVGGHVGFVSTQLVQLLRHTQPQVFSFEPVPYTFSKLLTTIQLLDLESYIYPICSALSDKPGLVQLSYSTWDTMLAQIVNETPNGRVGNKVTWANATTLDLAVANVGRQPHLIKVDVEGHEVKVFKGATNLLSLEEPPALHFELNPTTLREAGHEPSELAQQLARYDFFYVSESDGLRDVPLRFGQPIEDLTTVQWVINIFAVPKTNTAQQHWQRTLPEAKKLLCSFKR